MQEHEPEKRPERFYKSQSENGTTAYKMAYCEEPFGREMTVSVLIAEKHAHDSGDRKGIQDPGLFRGAEVQAWEVSEDQWKPSTPDHILENHHQKELEPD
jgi:hypothetical protein